MMHPIRLVKIGVAVLLGLTVPSSGQEIINGSRTIFGNWDASVAATTKPVRAGTVIPASCGVGEMFFKTDATAGANLYLCATANTWTQLAAGSGAIASVFGRTGAVTAQAGDYNFSQISGTATAAQLPTSIQYFSAGAGAPAGACTAGQNAYLDTTNLDYWFCDATNAWKKVLSTTNSGPFALTGQTGTAPATPAAGAATIYLSSTDKTLHTVSDAGTDMRYAGVGEANTWGAYLQDFSASTIKLPVAASFTTTSNGGIGYDSTGNRIHAAINAADAIIPTASTTAPANGNCVRWGSNFQLQDSGAGCGGSGGGATLSTTGSGYVLPFGDISYSTSSNSLAANELDVWQFVCCFGGASIAANTIDFIVWTSQASSHMAAAIYSDSNGSPGNLLASTGGATSTTNQTLAQSGLVSTYTLNQGSVYWIGLSGDTASLTFASEGSTNATFLVLAQTGHPREGKCANTVSWSAGTPTFPSTCGALSSLNSQHEPVMAILP